MLTGRSFKNTSSLESKFRLTFNIPWGQMTRDDKQMLASWCKTNTAARAEGKLLSTTVRGSPLVELELSQRILFSPISCIAGLVSISVQQLSNSIISPTALQSNSQSKFQPWLVPPFSQTPPPAHLPSLVLCKYSSWETPVIGC